ncbi:hypothetical protein BC830DRAFT_1101833 [Chytriomyces sp. MP71]|nr:hypothetical protein BC830DRAFT_1101833 [Chytriomyces sp. MP71]
MSVFVPVKTTNAALAKRSHFGTDTSSLHPHYALNRGPIPQQWAHVSRNELEAAQHLADTTLDPTRQRREFENEKRRLHHESVEKSKIWPGTILGERIRSLKKQDLREQELEEEKQKVDKEWHIVVAAERQEKIRAARELQKRMGNPEMRMLNSKLALANILVERDRQIEHKKRADALIYANRVDERAIVERANKENIMEIVKKEVARREAKKVAEEYPAVIQAKKDKKKREKEADQLRQQQVIETAHQELLQEAEMKQKVQQAGFKEVQEAYKRAIQDKEVKAEQAHLEKMHMDLEHELHNKMVDFIKMKRTQLNARKNSEKDHIYEIVTAMNRGLATKAEHRIANAVEKMQNAHKGKMEKREMEDRERRIRLQNEVAQGRYVQVQQKMNQKEKELQEGAEERKRLDLDFADFQESISAGQHVLEVQSKKHYKGLEEQIKHNDEARKTTEQITKSLDRSLIELSVKDQESFRKEAIAAVEEFRQQGKNVVPAIHVIQPRRPFPVAPYESNYNTYARLGFMLAEDEY